eukprot:gnl/TRDRNA2_/TRDRNA2_171662_c1_seq2.p1 gnl/TRDRNA2_/TRDRNA2_171662_c1~~gnl/TRDRNA2_/TRDRNA2_171662_c1_seq2.p1  ORF type:complete len:494 (+),score=123.82 gnl/TRDRNA2_/TRDRNA2_171662_c1_seq2:126-1607(+)
MKLDAQAFRYITKDEFRVLAAVEVGMRNHEIVPVPVIENLAGMRRGGTYKLLQNLLRNKLVGHENKKYDGYRLSYGGYDYLALRALVRKGSITAVGRRLGVGKESDVHFCSGANGELLALKLHRLGRVSFRSIKKNRDYLQNRSSASWQYMARLAAVKEFAYMKALKDEGFPVPTPVDQNRHAVVMSFVDATPMYQVRSLDCPSVVCERLFRLLVRLARAGIIHGDFNEFNLMLDREQRVTLIDFPQVVSINHPNAEEMFNRDIECIRDFSARHWGYYVETYPTFADALGGVEATGGMGLATLKVEGLSKEEDSLIVAAHKPRDIAAGEEGSDEEEEHEEEEGDEVAEAGDTERALEGLVPAGGRAELSDSDDEADSRALTAEGEERPETEGKGDGGYSQQQQPPVAEENVKADRGEDDDGEDSEEDISEEDETTPGQVSIAKGPLRRKRTGAKEAQKNLQKQKKKPPAKANCQKSREARRARHECKDVYNWA